MRKCEFCAQVFGCVGIVDRRSKNGDATRHKFMDRKNSYQIGSVTDKDNPKRCPGAVLEKGQEGVMAVTAKSINTTEE